jgi:hypothetical protein
MWQSTKQATVTTSTTEAELLSLSHAAKEVRALERVFRLLRFDPEHPLSISCDNRQTLRLLQANLPVVSTKLRHIDIHQFWLRQEVEHGRLQLQWIPTKQNSADGFTKPLGRQEHEIFTKLLGLTDISSLVN